MHFRDSHRLRLRLAPWAALPAAWNADAVPIDLPSLAASPLSTYGAFAIAIAVVIVLLLWYAVDDEPDEASKKSQPTRHRRERAPRDRRDSDRRAA